MKVHFEHLLHVQPIWEENENLGDNRFQFTRTAATSAITRKINNNVVQCVINYYIDINVKPVT